MTKRMMMLLVALSGLGVAVGGCGDDKNAATTAATTTTAPADAPAGATATEPDTSASPAASGVPGTPEAKQAVAACEKQADALPQLSAKAKAKIGEVCAEAGSGDANGAIKAAREACQILVEGTVPAGAAKDAALSACKQSTVTP